MGEPIPTLSPPSPDFFRSIVEVATEGVWTIDAAGVTTYANPALGKTLGYPREELVGRNWIELVPPELRDRAHRMIDAHRSGESERRELALRHRHGHLVWAEMVTTPLRGPAGEDQGALAIVEDITDRRRFREERERMLDELTIVADVVDKAPVAIIVFDTGGVAWRMNEAMRALLGVPDVRTGIGQFNVRTDPGVLSDGTSKRVARVYEGETVRTEHQVDLDTYRSWSTRGGTVWVEELLFPVKRADGSVLAAVCMMQDVTERKRIEEALREHQKHESLGLLAGGIAHEFNNLFAAMLGQVDLATDIPRLPAPAHAALTHISGAIQQAAERTRQLQAFAGAGLSQPERTDLCRLARETVELVRFTLPSTVQLDLAVCEGGLPIVADPAEVRQVVHALLVNASEAIGDSPGRITVRTGRLEIGSPVGWRGQVVPGLHAFVAVEDTGHGVPLELQDRIFDPFFSTRTTGRGLGLAAALGVVRNHGGGIRLLSPPGRSAHFTVALPLARADAVASSLSPPSHPGPLTVVPDTRPVVLLADDDDAVREVLERMIELCGYAVQPVVDGQEAVERFERDPDGYAAIVLDLLMPRMGGAEAYARVRALRPKVPVLLCSGYTASNLRVPPPGDHHARFLAKPFRREELRVALVSLVEGGATLAR